MLENVAVIHEGRSIAGGLREAHQQFGFAINDDSILPSTAFGQRITAGVADDLKRHAMDVGKDGPAWLR